MKTKDSSASSAYAIIALLCAGLSSPARSHAATKTDDCFIRSKLDPNLIVLSTQTIQEHPKLRKALANKDPSKLAGITLTDFDAVEPFEAKRCAKGPYFCIEPRSMTLTHQIFARAKNRDHSQPKEDLKFPDWSRTEDFPCTASPQPSFATFECTLEHEKVHVVLREEAIQESCGEFRRSLLSIQETTQESALKKARSRYQAFVQTVAAADQEEVAYRVEWDCNRALFEKKGGSCPKASHP
jgi:hypothetical protein